MSQEFERWISPISADAPAGVDLRHDPRAQPIREQIERLERVGSAKVNWTLVADGCDELLATVSKDLWFASYLAVAWWQQTGASSLSRGLGLWAALCERYPDAVYPQRPRARANALSFLLDRAEVTLADAGDLSQVGPELGQIRAALVKLREVAFERLGDDAPSFASLDRQALQLAAQWREQHPEAAQAQSVGGAAPQATPAGDETAAGDQGSSTSAEPVAPAALGDLSSLLKPIPGASPAGEDLSSTELWLDLRKDVVGKLEALDKSVPNWPNVAVRCADLIAHHSKDLTAMVYLTVALGETRGIEGVAEGLALLTQLVSTFGDAAFPTRPRRRSHVFAWLLGRLLARLSELAAQETHVAAFDACLAALDAWAAVSLGDGEHASSLRQLKELLETAKGQASARAAGPSAKTEPESPPQKPEAPVAKVAPAQAQPKASAAKPAAGAATLPSPPSELEAGNVKNFLSKLGGTLERAAVTLREASLADPMAYRLARIAVWLRIAEPPPHQDGRTRLVAPDRVDRRALEKLLEQQAWEKLLRLAELMLPRHRYWLDLSFYSAKALAELGDACQGARGEVEREARAFAERIAPVATFSFADGTKLASEATQAWLTAGQKEPGAGANHPTPDGTQSEAWITFEQCLKDLDGARLLLESKPIILQMPTERERFCARLRLAFACERAQDATLAFSLFDALDADVAAYGLSQWEPELAAQVVEAKVRCLSKLGGVEAASELRQLRGRLARLTPERLVISPVG